ncbi:hypothetical protein [Streptomyces europaeiscabiei]|uniref:hypothetical protein n=1 Tax=Streptomyces europaeiscabiei TaxID=146819 RepID=UPI0029A6D4EB|nr:hypothetical protein [Streptomyces europaeiscabiei]MDX3781965.1 hypothetical protein [Streptomyces europaeiscabiei]
MKVAGVNWVRPLRPAFQIRLHRPSGEEHGYHRSVGFASGVARADCVETGPARSSSPVPTT